MFSIEAPSLLHGNDDAARAHKVIGCKKMRKSRRRMVSDSMTTLITGVADFTARKEWLGLNEGQASLSLLEISKVSCIS